MQEQLSAHVRRRTLTWVLVHTNTAKQKSPTRMGEALFVWWSWRESNPRPQILRLQIYMLSRVFKFNRTLPDWQGKCATISVRF